MPAPHERLEFALAERGALLVPSPLVSRGRPAFDSNGPLPPSLMRDAWGPGLCAPLRANGEPWLAVHAGVGPARLLVSWAASGAGSNGRPRGDAGSGPPACYRIESAASSTRGSDGEFRLELRVTHNRAQARAHVIEFDGQSWVRVTVEAALDGHGVGIERLELHDASDGTDDVWLILGDALAREGLVAGGGEPGFAELVHERYPGYFPALLDETRSGEHPSQTLGRIVELLELHPHARHVALAYGGPTHPDTTLADAHAAALAALVATLLDHECSVVLARTPARVARRANAAIFNRAISELEARHGLVPGPDLSRWFDAHPEELGDDGRPTPEGRRAMQHLWVEALDVFYVPQ
jgi:hypothetical protein